MIRADIIATVGREYLVSNIENDEFSYPKAFRTASLQFTPIQNETGRTYEKLDTTIIKLPEKDGRPDYSFMESYMKALPYGDRI